MAYVWTALCSFALGMALRNLVVSKAKQLLAWVKGEL